MKRGWMGLILAMMTGVIITPLPAAIAGSNEASKGLTHANPLDQLNFFAKDWQCDLKDMTSSRESEPVAFQWSLIRELKDLWFIGQAMTSDRGVFERETLGYNTMMQKFGRTIIGDDGKFANFLSEGWENQMFTWEGRVANMVTQNVEKRRIVITKTADHSFKSAEYVSMPDELTPWMLVSEKSCVCEKTIHASDQ